ncbi:motility protein A [Marispirochaeta aestuarii]|uniref:Motility protein A n=1 Tax=Marispirochaeta aestuarii TaxID=1963862 RepID=A0A1Y1RW17_9SPIO|nr:motility protein A [Marispirochaeta aestuarii]ORC34269.1 motility protein A [Marispirochaeta aestuarii]
MDLGTIIGLILGFVMILMSIFTSGGSLTSYVDIPSIFMVIGGSFAALMVSSPLQRVLGMMRYLNHALNVPNWGEEAIISTLVNFSEKARREGLLALEDDLEEVEQEFMKKGIQLVVDGTDPEIIKNLLYNELNQIQERHQDGIMLFDFWGKVAPAFGMIGTLAGLIAMLANLNDADSIGSGMALALITTMYGAIFANLVLIPIKAKLEDRDKGETLVKEIMIEGILSIQSGDNPRILEVKLLSFLPPLKREAIMAESAAE